MWFWYDFFHQKNGGKRPFLTAISSVVFGMAWFEPVLPNGG
jgi:hypothetical protein